MDVEECFQTLMQARRAKSIALRHMERTIGVSATNIRKAESGKPVDHTLSKVIKWAEILGYEVQIVKKEQ